VFPQVALPGLILGLVRAHQHNDHPAAANQGCGRSRRGGLEGIGRFDMAAAGPGVREAGTRSPAPEKNDFSQGYLKMKQEGKGVYARNDDLPMVILTICTSSP
jgi:hypothetical protein